MSKNAGSIRKWVLALLAGAAFIGHAYAAKDVVQVGDSVCTRCHDEGEAKPVLSIGQTRHGTMADKNAGTCTSCHGESPTHVSKPSDVTERPKPTVNFGPKSATPIDERNQVCLNCHQGGQRTHWQTGAHAAANLECTSCHKIHSSEDPVRDRQTQPDVCFSCHKEQRAQVMRPNHHPIPERKVVCVDCHNPHGSAGPKLMQRDSVVATCYTCHMEKRGPFVRSHQPVTEDCTICHTPHGSVNDNLLKQRAPFLCQQCHEPTSHQGTIASTGMVAATNRYTLGRGCLNCHTNIHGSNNPLDDTSNGRALQR
ncbi:DmsE family decaheme c-type cytochrome [Aromatoleum petrolei]|uniref:DmsE family decaheme c-type cytochrome n=1 Tax=Aromatoleum petrolei TaxID=76116 RepID=A0ABX1MR75_9RHOO|nr:DmsE family decaheme c-type cytochrome [Aromatoleum petrolei]NMF90482.1 DmsE family decaheme c-type cytochrome [Aromatoleum petrolei]QTQ35207.1 Decaheme c-type cytochrome, DmsE family [Aromatoleum petrolei]